MRQLLKYSRAVFFLLFGCGLLMVAVKGINLDELNMAIRTIPLKWVFFSMIFGYLAFVFRGLRWLLLIRPLGYNPKISDLINAIAFGYLFNSFIPRSGELVRCTALNKVTNIPVSKLFGHVLLERMIDFILLGLCIFLSLLLNYQDFMNFSRDFFLPKKVLLYIAIIVVLSILIYKMRKYFLNDSQLKKINLFLQGIKSGFLSIQQIQNKFLFSIYTGLIWLCYLLMTVVCFYCFSETKDLNFGQGLFIMVAGGLGMVVPTPTGIGSYHYLVIKALIGLNISSQIAQFFAIIVHSSQAIMIIITGFFAMIFLYCRKNKIKNGF